MVTDALARLAPVAEPLLRDVDNALATLGAPPSHPVWRRLRSLAATPAEVVMSVAEWEPDRLRGVAASLREQAEAYERVAIAAAGPWQGAAAEHYAAAARAVRDHLCGDPVESMAGRLRAQASAADAVADWQRSGRDAMAAVLAGVLMSRQSLAVRSHPALGNGRAVAMWQPATDGLTEAVLAAADIGAALLGVADEVLGAGERHVRTLGDLGELVYRPPTFADPIAYGGAIRLW
jgi:hypothetical protein